MRGSGKTSLLQETIRLNQDKEIGVRCFSGREYQLKYSSFKNCTRLAPEESTDCYDIILGDEIHIAPKVGQKTACALTMKWIELSLRPSNDMIDAIKRAPHGERYEVEIGQYLRGD